MCCMWFAHDCAHATWAYVLETVRGAVRRLQKISNSAFEPIIIIIITWSSAIWELGTQANNNTSNWMICAWMGVNEDS